MKNIILIFVIIFVATVFSGCSYKMDYDKYSIERNLNNNISKIDGNIKIVDLSEQTLTRKLKSYSVDKFVLEASNVNTEISKEFFNQYFSLNKNSADLFIVETKLEDYTISSIIGNPNNLNVEVKLNIKVIKNGKVILDKKYVKMAPGVTYWEWRLTLVETTITKCMKGVLSVYENEFKADLLKALKENK